jgi:hypothetical protein
MMNKLFPLILLALVLNMSSGCDGEDLSAGRNPRTTYALDSIDFEEQLEMKETPSKVVFSFQCKTKTSSKYQFRLYYPEVPKSRDLEMEEASAIKKEILTSLVGLKFELIEKASGKSVAMHEIWNSSFWDNRMVNIGNNSPASTWLVEHVRLKKGQWYRILVTLPAKGDTEEMFLKPILAGGLTIPPSL